MRGQCFHVLLHWNDEGDGDDDIVEQMNDGPIHRTGRGRGGVDQSRIGVGIVLVVFFGF